LRIAYGSDRLQYGELSLPRSAGPHPVVINVHGGVWLSEFTLDHSRAQASALAESGFAVWNIEYRRVGDAGGGWPGTFLDVARAADYLPALAQSYPIDVHRICVMGHSAGGHLALWLAARRNLPADSELYVTAPLLVRGVVALAPASELAMLHERAIFDGVVGKLMGGSPEAFPERYRSATPSRLAPLGVPQRIIVGRLDTEWGWIGPAYARAAQAAGDTMIQCIVAEGVGHFELIAPDSAAWPLVLRTTRALLPQYL
jgi:acetyl esterase/lipase